MVEGRYLPGDDPSYRQQALNLYRRNVGKLREPARLRFCQYDQVCVCTNQGGLLVPHVFSSLQDRFDLVNFVE